VVADLDKDAIREYLHWVKALLSSMETALRGDDASSVWKYGGYKQFARKWEQILSEIRKGMTLPPIVECYETEALPGGGDSLPYQQKAVFESVHANASILKGILEGKLGVVEDETAALRDFLQARLRSAIFSPPEKERQVQDAVEQLLIGRGLQKGEDYDREVGRVKISVKESVPDFILMKLDMALEVKLVPRADRAKEVVDEVNADIAAYSTKYRYLLFVVYDMGHIRDEVEFRKGLERAPNVSVIVVKQ
jgi:hypothetical protein